MENSSRMTNREDNSGNPEKARELIQWSVKHWKSQGMKSANLGRLGIIAWNHATESKTHIFFILC